jgi:hypothetical protein
MHLWLSEVHFTLFNGLRECPNPDCLPPSFKLEHADVEFLLDTLLFISGDATNLSL